VSQRPTRIEATFDDAISKSSASGRRFSNSPSHLGVIGGENQSSCPFERFAHGGFKNFIRGVSPDAVPAWRTTSGTAAYPHGGGVNACGESGQVGLASAVTTLIEAHAVVGIDQTRHRVFSYVCAGCEVYGLIERGHGAAQISQTVHAEAPQLEGR
jgi:hypothetical protein